MHAFLENWPLRCSQHINEASRNQNLVISDFYSLSILKLKCHFKYYIYESSTCVELLYTLLSSVRVLCFLIGANSKDCYSLSNAYWHLKDKHKLSFHIPFWVGWREELPTKTGVLEIFYTFLWNSLSVSDFLELRKT
jgi:hypothetical protein